MKVTNRFPFLPIPVILCVALVLTGGFFDYSVALIGGAIAVALFVMLLRGEAFYQRDKRRIFLIPFVILCIAGAVSFWSVDYMDNLMGVMRLGVICLWMSLLRCRDNTECLSAKKMLPFMGSVNVLLSIVCFCIPAWSGYFWENNRLAGFFQYANTNALFLAIGILILIYYRGEYCSKLYWVIQIVLLTSGFLLTGSRSVLLLLVGWGIWYAIKTKEFRKPFFAVAGALGLLGGLFVAITGNTTNVGRIFTLFTSNSTLWGRLLYYRDAILLLMRRFWGLGRMGYYYSQGSFQSGVYRIRFVHNDFLQLALDYGVIVLLLAVVFLIWQLYRGKQSRTDKELLVFVCLASLADFHFQYILIVLLACLFLDHGEGVREKKAQLKENYIILPVYLLIFGYICMGTWAGKVGNYGMALSLLPDYTLAQEKKILSGIDAVECYEEACRLLRKNPSNITAYIVRGGFYVSQLQIREGIADLDRMLELDPYNVEYYRQYEILLQNYCALCESGEIEDAEMELAKERMESLPLQLEKMKERTSPFAYKIKDKPEFSY